MIKMQCPNCSTWLAIPDQYAGTTGKCNKCEGAITVPWEAPSFESLAFNVDLDGPSAFKKPPIISGPEYEDYPWYRRNLAVLLFWLFLTPVGCILLLSGPVYYRRKGEVREYKGFVRYSLGIIGLGLFIVYCAVNMPTQIMTQSLPAKRQYITAPVTRVLRQAFQQQGVSLAQFNQIQEGMTYDQVRQILGSSGAVQSSSIIPGIPGVMLETKTVMYTWEGCGFLGANMSAMFQNDVMNMKAQFGLQ